MTATGYIPFTPDRCREREKESADQYYCYHPKSELCGMKCDISNGFPPGCPYPQHTMGYMFKVK